MSLVVTLAYALHAVLGGLLAGAVAFTAWSVLPGAADGDADPDGLAATVGKLTTLSRAGAVVLVLTGGHMAQARYTFDTLLGSPRGHLVLTMLALWLVMTALVEVGASRIRDGLDDRKVRTPAREGGPFMKAAGVVAVLLLLDAGVLASGAV